MDYNKMNCCEAECSGEVSERDLTLIGMQQKSTAMSDEILSMVRRISMYFFGPEDMKTEEKRPMPDCFRSDLEQDLQLQSMTIDVLMRMFARIGS